VKITVIAAGFKDAGKSRRVEPSVLPRSWKAGGKSGAA